MTDTQTRLEERTGSGGPARPAALAGVVGGLIGATCCVGPAVGVAVGAGSGSFLLAMADYRPQVFVIGAIVAFTAAAVLFARRRRSCPTDAARRTLRSRWLDAGILAFAVTYALGRFLVPRLIELLS
jgi:hypothetical protein